MLLFFTLRPIVYLWRRHDFSRYIRLCYYPYQRGAEWSCLGTDICVRFGPHATFTISWRKVCFVVTMRTGDTEYVSLVIYPSVSCCIPS